MLFDRLHRHHSDDDEYPSPYEAALAPGDAVDVDDEAFARAIADARDAELREAERTFASQS
jgi:hypothetical protein